MVVKVRFSYTLPNWILCVFILWGSSSISVATDPMVGGSDRKFDLDNPSQRQVFIDRLRERQWLGIERAAEYLRRTGKPKRWQNGHSTCELMAIDENGQFIVYTTLNANSAISNAADIVRNDPYYRFTGNDVTVGVWDTGKARSTHQELTGRAFWKDLVSSADNYHSTAVAGTIAAAGVDPLAKGMAPLCRIWGYNWTGDTSEMAGIAMSSPGQVNTIQLSNHSYGIICGWYFDHTDSRWEWYGQSDERESYLFGLYYSSTEDIDSICYNSPYYLPVWAAGNDRGDGRPTEGTTYYINNSVAATFYAVSGPYADNYDNGGFDTLMPAGCAKNVLTVGGVNDAVSGGLRDLSQATMSSLSAWGPTDDGRIKPDVVANCTSVYSCNSGSDAAYQTLTGTSMAAPAAVGAAAQLVELYGRLFPGQAMRSSTIKGLLIHSADDLGNPGPDYKFGWGLINAEAAVDKILLHKRNATLLNITENSLKPNYPNRNLYDDFPFVWDGVSPIKATLCYTDPAGTALSSLDNRNSQLINDLDITITAPNGIKYNEFVLDWLTPNNLATEGNNDRDNVKQVFIESPTQSGTYTIRVDFDKLDGTQNYSLIISGQAQPAIYDIDGDLSVGVGDFATIASNWLTGAAASDIYPAAGDGVVDMLDFALLSQGWLAP